MSVWACQAQPLSDCTYDDRPRCGCNTGQIVCALLSKAIGKPDKSVAHEVKRLELSKGCVCLCVGYEKSLT